MILTKVGSGAEGDTVGRYGLEERNTRRDRLVQFCTEHGLLIANTFFKHHPRRLYTWISSGDKKEKVSQDLKKFMKSVKTYPGADVSSDHNPVVADFRLRRFKTVRKERLTRKLDVQRLRNPDTKAKAEA